MTLPSTLGLSLTTLAALGLTAVQPAAAQTTISAGGTIAYGTFFQPTYGTSGFLEFDTTASGQAAGNFVTQDTFAPPTGSAARPGATTIFSLPSYVSAYAGFSVDHADGYGAADIAPGKEAGLVGYAPGDGAGNVFSFTTGTAQSFTFGVIGGFPNNTAERPGTVTLTGSGSTPASAADISTVLTGATPTIYLFNVANAAPGETFTLSVDQGYISAATFDAPAAVAAVPEAASTVSLSLLLALGLGGIVLARRRKAA